MERPVDGLRRGSQSRAAICRSRSIAGVAIVGALYILTNAAVQYVLPAAAIAGTERPASDAIGIVLGWRGAWLVSAGMAISILVAMNGTIMTAARVPWAVARDRYFFSALA